MTNFVCILTVALLLAKHCFADNPGLSIKAFGTHLSTASIIEKIESALYNYDHTFGRLIYFKKNDGCLDASKVCGSNWYCLSPSKTCNPDNPTQQWRMVAERLEVAARQHLPLISGPAPCLDCIHARTDCDLTIRSCLDQDVYQQYFVRVHPDQIDLAKNRIYFSFHLKGFPNNCLTDTFNVDHNVETFKLQDCHGTNDQSFYIGLDLSKELKEIRDIVARGPSGGHVNVVI